MLALTAVFVAACATIGQGVLALCGYARWRWWAPALGYAVLLIVLGQTIRVPRHLTDLVVIGVLLAVAPLALRSVRAALREALPDLGGLGVLVLFLSAIPFLAIGRTGVLGASVSNDMSQHLLGAFYLRTQDSLLPMAAIGGDLITSGYPLGPHSIAAGLAQASGLGEEQTFSALTLAIPVLTALAAVGVVPAARRGARWALATVVGLGYLPAAYLAQGAYKEIGEALLVLATAVALNDVADVTPDGSRRRAAIRLVLRGVPIGLLLGGAVYNYSYGGASWIVATAVLFIIGQLAREPRAIATTVRRLGLAAVGAVIVGLIAIAPEAHRIQHFRNSIFGEEPLENRGNLFHAINPLETLGVWFSGDFRFNPDPRWPSYAASFIALGALVYGLGWCWRRRQLGLPAALIAAIAVWVELATNRNIYNAAKGLMVIAPIATALIGAPLAAAWSARAVDRRRRGALVTGRAIGVGLLFAAAIASLAVLRWAPVGLGPHEKELASMRPLVDDKKVLFLTNDHFAQWELRGAELYTTSPLYAPGHLGQHPQKLGGSPLDADNYGSKDLDKVDFIVTPGGRYQSQLPPNWKLARRTPSFLLYRRRGKTPVREPVEPPGVPGAVLDCRNPRVARSLHAFPLGKHPRAGVLPRPVVRDSWMGSIAQPGKTASMRVRLPRGRWDVSLQYVSTTGLEVRGPRLNQQIAPNYGIITAYRPAGTLTADGRPFTLSVTARKRTWFGELLGSPYPTRAPLTPGNAPLWHVAFTRHGETPRRVSARSACGRYVDWVAPAGGRMRGR
jgi:hypothetical protein